MQTPTLEFEGPLLASPAEPAISIEALERPCRRAFSRRLCSALFTDLSDSSARSMAK
jgi:hypothetical protein